MSQTVNLAVVGAGLIGKRHVGAITRSGSAALHSIVDPDEDTRDYAAGLGVPWYPSLDALFSWERPDGVILATPNQMHVENGLTCVATGLPALVEKPIATDSAAARTLVEAAEAAGVPLLVGHHRRHNPLIAAARGKLAAGALGTVVAVHGMYWLHKPDDYFEHQWRREPGAGPVFLNLIHDIDLLRHLCGEIVWVQAMESNAVRGYAVEETAAMLLRFANGALGTVTVSDAVVAPWSWEMTARENPAYPASNQACYLIGGTQGSLELPAVRLWSYAGKRSCWEPICATRYPIDLEDPLVRQVQHFARVVREGEAPLVSGREGLRTLQVIEAVKRSAAIREPVVPEGAAG